MSKYLIEKNTLTSKEGVFLSRLCSNFNADQTPHAINFYHKQVIKEENYTNIQNFLDLSKDKFKDFTSGDYELTPDPVAGIWVNKLTPDTNKNDPAHTDLNKLSSVTFLNSNFEGGALELNIDKEVIEVKPELGKTVFFEGSKIPHRAQPVTEGERYTLVVFWTMVNKTQKTLM